MSIVSRSIRAWVALLVGVLGLVSPAYGQVAGLSMPGGFEVTSMGDGVRAYLRWSDSSVSEDHFEIVREKASGVIWGDQAVLEAPKDAVNKMDFPGSGLFRYRMRAVNAAGGSLYTAWTFCQVELVPPTAPWGLTFTDMGDGERARLDWTDRSNNEARFEIIRQRQSSSGVWFGDTVLIAAANTETYVNRPGVGSYRFRIRSVNTAGSSAWSGWVNGVIAPLGSSGGSTTAPLAPTNMEAVNLGDGVRAYLRWDDNADNEDGYRVFRDQLIAGTWTQDGSIELEANATNMIDSPGDGTFRYAVRAFNDIGASPFSNTSTTTVELLAPTVPTDLEFTDLGDGMRGQVRWTDRSNNEEGFEILRQRQNASGAWLGDTVLMGAANTEVMNNMPGPGTFRYRIRAANDAGTSAWSGWVVGIIQDVAPAAPTDLSGADLGNQSQIQLTWTDNSHNESGFELEKQTQAGGLWGPPVTLTADENTEVLTDPAGVGTHRYRVRAINAVGPSTYGAWVEVAVGGTVPPAPPSGLAVMSLNNGLQTRLNWTDNSTNETGFEIERQSEQTFSWGPTVTMSAGANAQLFTDAPGVGTHRYRVRATGPGGASAFTAWVQVAVVSPLPAMPGNLAVVTLSNGLQSRVTWADNSNNELGFQIERQTLAGTTWGAGATLTALANATMYTDSPGVGTHRYRVRAVNNAGGSAYTAWAAVTIVAIGPAAPSGLAVASLNDGVRARVDWVDNSSDETGFQIERQSLAGSTWVAAGMITVPANSVMYIDSPGIGTHRYRVRAVNLAGSSAYTAWEQVAVSGSAPAAPSGLQAVDAGNRRALLSWADNSTNETRFDIERQPAFSSGIISVSANVTGYIDNCGAGTFQYRVRAANTVGISPWTGWVSVIVLDTIPTAPSGLIVTDMGNQSQVRLNWLDNSDNETGFNIERQTNTGGSNWGSTTALTAAANATMRMDNPGPGVHRYRISSVNGVGQSPWTGWSSVSLTGGWTQFAASAATKKVYVSSSMGNDSNTGLSEAAPVRTLAKGYSLLRDGYPDWMLLRRGDTWSGVIFANWAKNGRSGTEMMMLGAYGDPGVQRPIVRTGVQNFFFHNAGGSFYLNHVAIVSIHATADAHVGTTTPVAVSTVGPGTNFLIEDCRFENFSSGIVIQGEESNGYMNNVVVRRNTVTDCYHVSEHSQGMFAIRINGLTIEENVFDYNGWKTGVYAGDMFNHNFYLSSGCTSVRVSRNIITRASSHGIQMRSGGQCDDNLLVRNSVALFVAKNSSLVKHNVVLEGKDITPSDPRGWGIETLQVQDALVEYNIIANKLSNAANFGLQAGFESAFVGQPHQATFRKNIVYNWKGVGFNIASGSNNNYNSIVVEDNYFQQSGLTIVNHLPSPFDANRFRYIGNRYDGSSLVWRIGLAAYDFNAWRAATGETTATVGATTFPAPDRSVASYNAYVGGAATFDAFIAECRQQRRGYWRAEYTAPVINQYIRDGFGMPGPQ